MGKKELLKLICWKLIQFYKKKRNLQSYYLHFFCTLFTSFNAIGQVDTLFPTQKLEYTEYLKRVTQNNLSLLIEKFNIDLAQAQILIAKVLPDPTLEFMLGDNGERRMGLGYAYSASLSWEVPLGKKRKARIKLAQEEMELAKLLVSDFFRNLRAQATLAYVESLKQRKILEAVYQSWKNIYQLAQGDSLRFIAGAISEIDARQSKVEAGMLFNQLLEAQANWKNSLVQLSQWQGLAVKDTLFYSQGSLNNLERNYDLSQLIENAIATRTDILAAHQNHKRAQSLLQLVRANRITDISIALGISGNTVQYNVVAPTPSFTTISGTIAMPLKFSNNLKGDIQQAELTVLQTAKVREQIALQIETEVISAFNLYQARRKQAQQFESGLLTEAQKVLAGKVYSYQRGESSLLEVLNAQRTYNELQINYYETLANYANALIDLQRVAGIWDIYSF
ncbi:MAG: TolC family protein [Bacteroidia bacterium]|nr:TolC family protein [Bacteroidia bacterium]MDW8159095.1 TolC family protein [Bacteroidia bacterium]